MRDTTYPLTTGAAADLLGTTEPRLAETVRRRHVHPPPPILAGRRLWSRRHLLQAAQHLGVLTDNLRERLAASPHDLSLAGGPTTPAHASGSPTGHSEEGQSSGNEVRP